ncbi:MAG: ABC transporter permease [Candidatus Zixiibacteriota bacterium]
MLRNYLKVAVRNLIRQKLYVAVNVAGLAIGLTVCLLIIGFLKNELTFEHCHLKRDRIYRVDGIYQFREASVSMANIMPALGPAMAADFPEVERAVRLRVLDNVTVAFEQDLSLVERKVFAAEPALLDIFTLPLKYGNPKGALEAPYSVIISSEMAEMYFPDLNPIGQAVRLNDKFDCQITGVLDEIPVNTQIFSNFIVSYATLEKLGMNVTTWNELFLDYTYLLLNPGADPAAVEVKIPAFLERYMEPETAKMYVLQLQSLNDIYMHSQLSYELQPSGNIQLTYIFSCIAALILIIATINFVNLTTARTTHRLKEVGVRKTVGASRMQLVKQFLSESFLMTLVSMLLGLVFFELTRPLLETFIERPLAIDYLRDPVLISSLVAMVIIVGVVSGSYPAFVLSRHRPSLILRGGSARQSMKSFTRRVLVAFQFTLTIGLLCFTFAIYKQIDFSLSTDLGYDKDNVVLVDIEEGLTPEKRRLIADEIIKSGAVEAASIASTFPGEERHALYSVRPENKPDEDPTLIHGVCIDPEFCNTLQLRLLEGRNLTDNPADVISNVLINEAAVKYYGLEQPVGFKFLRKTGEFTVVGVVKDFHTHSLKNEIMPVMFLTNPDENRIMALRLPEQGHPAALAAVKEVWDRVIPDRAFEPRFIDDLLMEYYRDEQKTAYLFTTFSLLAVLIACLGVFGLSAYMAEQRTKEIGIRKVLGASLTSLIRLLSKEFFVLVMVANVIAWPLAWEVINRWLEAFAYRTEVSWYIFVLSGLMALVIALTTVGYQAVKAALANPVDTLKYE